MITPTPFTDRKIFLIQVEHSGLYIFISNNKWFGYINHVSQIGTEREVYFLVLPMGVNSSNSLFGAEW